MGMRVHELHAAAVHAPLALLPAAAAVDMAAALSGNRTEAKLGRTFWWIGAGSSLFAGLSGLAASQEVRADDPEVSDMMWLHGMGNLGLVVSAFGMAAWRSGRQPTVTQATVGLLACAASAYTAYLGGQMVYERGVGVNPMPRYTGRGVEKSPALLSRSAPGAFVRDAVRGLRWLLSRGSAAVAGRNPLARSAFGVGNGAAP